MTVDASNVDFTLSFFSSAYRMFELATVDDPVNGIIDSSAVAVFYMAQSDINNIFKFQTDSYDFSNTNYTDIHYLIYMDNWPSSLVLNPANAMLDQIQSTGALLQVGVQNRMLVKHDFLRYLAKSLFNTPQGVDLFNNESQLIANINTIGYAAWHNDISGGLWKYATTSSRPIPEDVTSGFIIDTVSGLKATTDDLPMSDNICRYLMNKLLENNTHRFQNVQFDVSGIAPVPIYVGDTLSFKFTTYPAPGQHNLTGVPPLMGRAYEIRIVIDDGSHVNTVSDNDTLVDAVYMHPPLTPAETM